MTDTSLPRWTKRIVIALLFLLCVLALAPVRPAAASAPVLLPGASWFGGVGVNVCGSSTDPYCGNEPHVGGIPSNWWQCVELAQRFYQKQGWSSGTFAVTYAYQIWTNTAPSKGWGRQAQGSITSVEPGDLLVFNSSVPNSGGAGHVSVVDSVTSTQVKVVQQNASSVRDTYGRNGGTLTGGSIGAQYLMGVVHHPGPRGTSLAQYANTVVQWDGDTKTQRTAWFVTQDLRRLWIPDSATYNCLKGRGATGPYVLPSTTLNQLPDQNSRWAACGDQMTGYRTLRRGMYLKSGDGRYLFVLQTDGNLVLYGPSGRALWAMSRLISNWRDCRFAVFQSDGNFVCYTDSGTPLWSSRTNGRGGNRLIVQNDGNVVIYAGSTPLWSTHTAGQT